MLGQLLNQILIMSIKSDTSANDQYHVSQLNDELEKAIKAIDNNQLSDADTALTHFMKFGHMLKVKFKLKMVLCIRKLKIKYHIIKVY